MAKGKYAEWLEPDNLLRLEAWARDGLTDEQIAENMVINVATLYRYKNDFNEICKALKKGKEVVDIIVENALFKRAIGYEYEEDCSTKEGIVRLTKYAHPDVTAQIYWLKNRKPKQWRDKQPDENNSDNTLLELAKAISGLKQNVHE